MHPFLTLPYFLVLSMSGYGQTIDWVAGPDLSQPFEYHIAVAEGAEIYVAGGPNAGTCMQYSTREQAWAILKPMPTERSFVGGEVLHGDLYVAGGLDATAAATTLVEAYNFRSKTWRTIAPMHFARSRFAVVVCGNRLYALGGLDVDRDGNYANLITAESYDAVSGTWTSIPSMHTGRHGHSAFAFGDLIYVIGGYTDSGQTGSVEIFNTSTGQWSSGAPMPTARGFAGGALIDTSYYVIAGRIPGGASPTERYDVNTDTWHVASPFPHALNRFGCTAVEGLIHVIGGEGHEQEMWIGRIQH